MPTLTQNAPKTTTGIFDDLNEEFDDTIALFVTETDVQLDRLVALAGK